MALEIEHKYLVKDNNYLDMETSVKYICQGYLSRDPHRTVRVRTVDNKGYITVKGLSTGDIRAEFEYEIPVADARELLDMCIRPILEKRRHIVPYAGKIWEVDEFLGHLFPLVIAEIELSSPEEKYELPSFIGQNVTGDPAYYNSNLIKSEPM